MDLENLLKELRAKMKTLVDLGEAITKEQADELIELMTKAEGVKAQIKAKAEIDEGHAKTQEELDAEAQVKVDEAVKVAVEESEAKMKAEFAKTQRLDFGVGVNVAKFGEYWKYDNLDIGDHAFMLGILQEAKRTGQSRHGATDNAMKALAIKVVEDKDESGLNRTTRSAMKAAGLPMKANELQQSDLNNFGEEWVSVSYSSQLWEKIRLGVEVAAKIPSVVVPQGAESIHVPIAGASATFYKVAQASEVATNPGSPITRTVTVSKMTTVEDTLSVDKMGCAVYYTGELEEDSLIPWASTLRADIEAEGMEILDHLCIDGDTETGATTNINDIGGTPGSTDVFLLFNGFRKLALVTNTANARDGGVLALNDFLETVKLQGLAGKNAIERGKVSFILDLWTHWKSLELAQVETRDVFSNPTIEGGMLKNIYGYDVIPSSNMHRSNQDSTYGLKANSAGKTDLDTASNNTKGAMLAVRWDQWMLGFKRRMTFETVRVPSADATEITALMRVGLLNRDTDASSISYNLTV